MRTRAEDYAASLDPQPRKIVVSLSVGCRACEYRVRDVALRDGFRECWGQRADVTPHLLDLYRVGAPGGRETPVANGLIEEGKVWRHWAQRRQ